MGMPTGLAVGTAPDPDSPRLLLHVVKQLPIRGLPHRVRPFPPTRLGMGLDMIALPPGCISLVPDMYMLTVVPTP